MPIGYPGTTTHGTRAGYDFHLRHNTRPCSECREALKEWSRVEYRKRRATNIAELERRQIAVDKLGRRTTKQAEQILTAGDLTWHEQAACQNADPRWFHHALTNQSMKLTKSAEWLETLRALTLCKSCQVTDECARDRELTGAVGVWGGVRWVDRPGSTPVPDRRFL